MTCGRFPLEFILITAFSNLLILFLNDSNAAKYYEVQLGYIFYTIFWPENIPPFNS